MRSGPDPLASHVHRTNPPTRFQRWGIAPSLPPHVFRLGPTCNSQGNCYRLVVGLPMSHLSLDVSRDHLFAASLLERHTSPLHCNFNSKLASAPAGGAAVVISTFANDAIPPTAPRLRIAGVAHSTFATAATPAIA